MPRMPSRLVIVAGVMLAWLAMAPSITGDGFSIAGDESAANVRPETRPVTHAIGYLRIPFDEPPERFAGKLHQALIDPGHQRVTTDTNRSDLSLTVVHVDSTEFLPYPRAPPRQMAPYEPCSLRHLISIHPERKQFGISQLKLKSHGQISQFDKIAIRRP